MSTPIKIYTGHAYRINRSEKQLSELYFWHSNVSDATNKDNSSGWRTEKDLQATLSRYLGIAWLIIVALIFSLIQGAGWKPVLEGYPFFLTFFLVASYCFVRDIRALRRRERGEPEPPPRKSYWEQDWSTSKHLTDRSTRLFPKQITHWWRGT